LNVQHFAGESETSDDEDRYESVECLACGGLHFVHVATGEKQG